MNRPLTTLVLLVALMCLGSFAWLHAASLRSQPQVPDSPGAAAEPTPPKAGTSVEPAEHDYSARRVIYPGSTQLEPNELGRVMILMYHRIGEPESVWQRTPANFRQDLQRLYDAGYRAVGLCDYLRGDIDLPAGTSPVILTFDDGTEGQFRYLEQANGSLLIDSSSAVGILIDFYNQHPDFGLEATFFINGYVPFGQPDLWHKKLYLLTALGMELGNHTYGHLNLGTIGPQAIQRQLGKWVLHVNEAVPEYQSCAVALPHGVPPSRAYRQYLYEGRYRDTPYEHKAALLVGARPAPSPYGPDFDPRLLPRIRADQKRLDRWLSYFQNHPEKRFVSDGDPNRVTEGSN
jgi:peptidoglycan/xylan/chitin deacetylase (PgdA/CDA1 family)